MCADKTKHMEEAAGLQDIVIVYSGKHSVKTEVGFKGFEYELFSCRSGEREVLV